MNDAFDINDLLALGTDDLSADTRSSSAPRETFPCGQCHGTGRYQGPRLHQPKSHCFACGGKGYFLKSYGDRLKARQQREAAQTRKVERVRASVEQTSAGLLQWIADNAHWCNLAASVQEQASKGRELTERQIEALNSIRAKQAQRREEKQAARSTELGGDLLVLRALISRAIENGKTKPTYRALGLTISEAPAHGQNAGALYVKGTDSGVYFGKIVGGKFVAGRDAEADVAARLVQIAADPKGEAIRYGTLIGKCFCCGAKLTAPESVARGIGPICFGKWGF